MDYQQVYEKSLARERDHEVQVVTSALQWAFALFRNPAVGGTELTRSEYEDVAAVAIEAVRNQGFLTP